MELIMLPASLSRLQNLTEVKYEHFSLILFVLFLLSSLHNGGKTCLMLGYVQDRASVQGKHGTM